MRFLTPILFWLAAGYVSWHNVTHLDRVLMFPFISTIVPSTDSDPAAMGVASVGLLVALGAVFFLRDLVRLSRDKSASHED